MPRIEMAINRSTASVLESRDKPQPKDHVACDRICPLHDELDFIENLIANVEPAISISSSVLSQHIQVSKKRIQDYIRQLNQSTLGPAKISTEHIESNGSLDEQPSTNVKTKGLLLQVVDNFVSCTVESIHRRINDTKMSKLSNPCAHGSAQMTSEEDKSHQYGVFEVMKNVKQFISGVKNYLIKTGEGELHTIMQEERSKLQWDECLNLDTILEEVLQLVIFT